MWNSYLGVSWNTEDLISCKQAVEILYFQKGVEERELFRLDFGNLDIEGVFDDKFIQDENVLNEILLWLQ